MSPVYDKGWAYFMELECDKCIDRKIKLVVRPKPRWCPLRLYLWLLRKVLYLEVFKRGEK